MILDSWLVLKNACHETEAYKGNDLPRLPSKSTDPSSPNNPTGQVCLLPICVQLGAPGNGITSPCVGHTQGGTL
jgi:hypothetical protein